MYDALDVANYVISYCHDYLHKGITNLQLQKILYYIQGAFLVKLGKPAFYDDIEAWKYGPVVSDVYHEFKYYLDGPIKQISPNIFNMDFDNYDPYNIIDICEQSIVDEVVKALINKHGYVLIQRTHEELPWLEAYGTNGIIDLSTMSRYFGENMGRIYGKW